MFYQMCAVTLEVVKNFQRERERERDQERQRIREREREREKDTEYCCFTRWVRVPLEEIVEDLQSLWGEGRAALAFFGGLAADEVSQVLDAVLVALLSLLHPALQHGLNLLGALRGDVQLLKPRVFIDG